MEKQAELFANDQPAFTFDEDLRPSAKIAVIGIGGAGGNSVNRMIENGIRGVELIAANTDIPALRASRAPPRGLHPDMGT